MNHSEWDFHRAEKGDDDFALPETPEDRADRFGLRTAFLVLCIAVFIAANLLPDAALDELRIVTGRTVTLHIVRESEVAAGLHRDRTLRGQLLQRHDRTGDRPGRVRIVDDVRQRAVEVIEHGRPPGRQSRIDGTDP